MLFISIVSCFPTPSSGELTIPSLFVPGSMRVLRPVLGARGAKYEGDAPGTNVVDISSVSRLEDITLGVGRERGINDCYWATLVVQVQASRRGDSGKSRKAPRANLTPTLMLPAPSDDRLNELGLESSAVR